MICPVAHLACTCICTKGRSEACAAELVERAAIAEFHGNLTRAEADRLAAARQVVVGFARQPGQRRLAV
jgi:hypothetical protein